MTEQNVTTEQMNSLRALADTNMKVSEAKALLIKIEETKLQYFKLRETETNERIAKLLADSNETLIQARNNYYETTQFYNTISSFADSLKASYSSFQGLLTDFQQRDIAWKKNMTEQEKMVADLRKEAQLEKTLIESEKQTILIRQKNLDEERVRVNDMRGTIEREIIRMNTKS